MPSSGPPAPIWWEMVTPAMASPPSVLLLDGAGRDRDPLARHVVEDVHLVAQGTAREHLEHVEGRLQRALGMRAHQIVDRSQRDAFQVAESLAHAGMADKASYTAYGTAAPGAVA